MDTTTIVRRLVCGAAGGVAGLAAMRLYWKGAAALTGRDPRSLTKEDAPHGLDTMSATGEQHHQEGESSTAAVGRLAREEVTGEPPQSDEETAKLSYGVHWTYGVAVAALYAAVRGRQEGLDIAGGVTFGTLLWALGDELAVPALGLSKGPTAFPVEQHVHRLGAHAAFGKTVAVVSQVLLRGVEPAPTSRRLAWRAAKKAGKTYLKYRAARAGVRSITKAAARLG